MADFSMSYKVKPAGMLLIADRDEVLRKVLDADEIIPAENERVLDRVFQLADVAGPVVQHQGRHRIPGKPCHGAALLVVEPLDETIHQKRDILPAFG